MVGVILVGIMYCSSESEVILNTVIYSLSCILCFGGISNFQYISGGILMVIVHKTLLTLAVKKIGISSNQIVMLPA